ADSLTAEGQITGLELGDSAEDQDTTAAIEISTTEFELEEADSEDAARSDVEETVAIFIEEAEEHLETIAKFLRSENEKVQDYHALICVIPALRGSPSMAQIEEIVEASSKVESLFKTLLQDESASTSKETAVLIQGA